MSNDIQIHGLSFSLYLKAEQIAEAIKRLALIITHDHKDSSPIIIGVLNGAAIFTADLVRELNIPCEVMFIKASSYEGIKSTDQVKVQIGSDMNIRNRKVLLVEDIIDTGATAVRLLELLESHKPASISLVTLLYKPHALKHNVKPDYVGFEIPNIFVLGYGMDHNGQGRNLKDIYALH